jgi:hypothetical protein
MGATDKPPSQGQSQSKPQGEKPRPDPLAQMMLRAGEVRRHIPETAPAPVPMSYSRAPSWLIRLILFVLLLFGLAYVFGRLLGWL